MADPTFHVNLNFAALWSNYFVKLQHLLDGINLLEAGASAVTEAQVAETHNFISFHPASNSRLAFAQAKEFAQDWLVKAFLRDSIEVTGLFMDECLSVCALLSVASKGKASGAELNHLLKVLPTKNHRLHFPDKLSKLEREFGIQSPFVSHLLSLNRARACVVHRLGVVSTLDVDDDQALHIRWRTTQMVAREIATEKEVILDRSGMLLEGESTVEVRFLDCEKTFALGEYIRLSALDLYSCIVTYWAFGTSMAKSIEEYGISLNLGPTGPKTEI